MDFSGIARLGQRRDAPVAGGRPEKPISCAFRAMCDNGGARVHPPHLHRSPRLLPA